MKVKDIIKHLDELAPLQYQESYDNAGLLVGAYDQETSSALACIDVTEAVIDEAISLKSNLIISHHPLIFGGLKSITGKNFVEKCVIKAIKHDIAIYASHTNLDTMYNGVSVKMADKLGLEQIKVLAPSKGNLLKIVVYVPHKHVDEVRNAMFNAGAGEIGNYNSCSFNVKGEGSFKGGDGTQPYVGESGKEHIEQETRIETITPKHIKGKVISAMLAAHPYEEVAYDIYMLENTYDKIGMGAIGVLPEPMEEQQFLDMLKKTFLCEKVKHTSLLNKKVRKIALCGGAGSFMLRSAIAAKADFFVSGDFKYHDYFNAENKVVIADIGHYESEQFTKDIFYDLLTKKITKFAVHLSNINTNPVKYY